MGLTATLDAPYFVGSPGSSTEVPGKYPVALAGHPYLLDEKSDRFRHQSIPLLRQQADQGAVPGENSLNPDDLWRRAQESWHFGAGQIFRDREEGNNSRFRSSKGIDPWTKYQLTLLPDVDQKRTSANTNLQMAVAGSRLYLIDGSALVFTSDITPGTPTFTTVTGSSPGTFTSICSDGFTTYATDGADIYSTTTSITTKSVYNTLNASILAYVKGRLMAAGTGGTKSSIYNITSGSAPAALFTHANSDFAWVGFAAGRSAIYAAGWSGDKSLLYRIALRPDAAGLDQPIVAGELPDGEIIRSIGSYLGFICIGTELGVRYCIPDGEGNLAIGPAIATDNPPKCFEGQDKFIWFGYTNYDSTSTGLGRLSLQNFTEPIVPAYASDLMATVQGDVLAVNTFNNRRVFTISGSGVWAEDTVKVASGTIDNGLIGYGIADQKTALFVDVRTSPLVGSYSVLTASDDGTFVVAGSETLAGDDGTEFTAGQVRGERFEVRLILNRDASATTTGPTILRWTLKVNPATELREFIFVPFLVHETDNVPGIGNVPRDPQGELTFLKSLRASRSVTVYQEGSLSYAVVLEDYEWVPHHEITSHKAWNGTFVAKLKTIQSS